MITNETTWDRPFVPSSPPDREEDADVNELAEPRTHVSPPSVDVISDIKPDDVGAAYTETFVFEATEEGGLDEPNGDGP